MDSVAVRCRKCRFLLFVSLLASCHFRPVSRGLPDFEEARRLLQSEQYQKAALQAEQGLAAAPPGSRSWWNFRLLQAEILLAQREAERALSSLGDVPPAGSGLAEQAARYHLLRAHAALLESDNKSARQQLGEAEAIANTLPRGRLTAEIELRRAAIATATADEMSAQRDLARVLEYARSHQDRPLLVAATGNMGFLLLRSGRYDQAIPWFEQTLSQARSLGAQASEARALGNLGSCFFRLGDLDHAITKFEEAEVRFASIGNRFERQIWLGNIGNIEESKQEYDAAARHYGEALEISERLHSGSWTATWLNNLAVVSIERRDWDAAQHYDERAAALKREGGDKTARAYSLLNEGRIALGRGQYGRAEHTFQSLLTDGSADIAAVLDAHAGLAEAYGNEHRDHAADTEFRVALTVMGRQQAALLDEQHKLTWFASVIRVYGQYVEYLMERNRSSEALGVVASSRGRVLSARLGERVSSGGRVGSYGAATVLQGRGVLLVYWVGARRSYAWVVNGNKMRHYDLPPEDQLRKWIEAYGDYIQQLRDPVAEESAAGESLYESLVAPAKLEPGSVMIAPDGPLYSLNFATLPVRSATGVHYWIEDAEIAVLPSFARVAPERPGTRSLLLIGDPVGVDAEFSELPFAGKEMNMIQGIVPNVRQAVYRRGDATPAAYLSGKPGEYSWIHFAAHATTNRDEPLQSALILSRGTGASYRLFARDIVGVPLHADLVTISACRSAGAHIYAGEGLVGMAWAFLKSGAHNVVGGLWDVNDESTADLMRSMYRELGQGSRPAAALRTAQLELLHRRSVYRKPVYWGPFEVFRNAGD